MILFVLWLWQYSAFLWFNFLVSLIIILFELGVFIYHRSILFSTRAFLTIFLLVWYICKLHKIIILIPVAEMHHIGDIQSFFSQGYLKSHEDLESSSSRYLYKQCNHILLFGNWSKYLNDPCDGYSKADLQRRIAKINCC